MNDLDPHTLEHESAAPGAYRRRILLRAEPGRVFAALEDDFHHLYAEITHDGRTVTAAAGKTLRIPRTTCPGAVQRLQECVGLPLEQGARGLDPRQQCTHLFDIARLAMAQALRLQQSGEARRQYDISVPDAVNKARRPELRRDGQLVLQWDVHGRSIVAPEAFACDNLFHKIDWKHLDPETLEAALALRRAIWISAGRGAEAAMQKLVELGKPLDGQWMPTSLKGACYSFQPEMHAAGVRIDGSTRDFTHRPEGLLSELAGLAEAPRW